MSLCVLEKEREGERVKRERRENEASELKRDRNGAPGETSESFVKSQVKGDFRVNQTDRQTDNRQTTDRQVNTDRPTVVGGE